MSKPINLDDYVKHFFATDRFGALLGAQFVSMTQDQCIFDYEVNPAHFNPNGILHGGALFGVMDSSQGMFVHYVLDSAYKAAATGTATVKYLAPVLSGKIRILTWLKSQEGRKLFVNSSATDSTGKTVATMEEVWIALL